jgi:hypothetical protein
MNVKELEAEAIRAQKAEISFTDFWEQYRNEIHTAVPRDRFPGFYRRLFCLCISGDLDGQEPIGSDECNWLADDEQTKPPDVGTKARWRGLQDVR